jgi:hypothetical protein
MAVRSTMAALIARVRLKIFDPAGTSQIFADQDIQDVLDDGREDVFNGAMKFQPTFVTGTIQFLDYFTELGDWEDNVVLKQYLTTVVTPSVSEPIPGHWQFAQTTYPPVFITGRTYDIYRAAADLLEHMAAHWQGVMGYDFASDGQSFKRSQAPENLQKLADKYRMKQRARSISVFRSDTNAEGESMKVGLGAKPLDYFASGNGS